MMGGGWEEDGQVEVKLVKSTMADEDLKATSLISSEENSGVRLSIRKTSS